MAAIVDLMSVSDQQAGANGVVKGSNPSQDCQSFPAALKDPSNIKDGEEFNFLKKDFDVPQRVAAQVDCLGVRVDELKSQFDDEHKLSPPVRRTSLSEEHNLFMKEKLDMLLDKDVNVMESGSFFSLFELGHVVSSVC